MNPGVPRRDKLKTAKKAFQKRSGRQLTEAQQRQLARSTELEKRARAIRVKEEKRKVNAQKKVEKDARARETRQRTGIVKDGDEGYISPRQTRVNAFFGNYQPRLKIDDTRQKSRGSIMITTPDEQSDSQHIAAVQPERTPYSHEPQCRIGNRRKPLYLKSAWISCPSSLTSGLPLQSVDPNVFVQVNELWAPPSQDSRPRTWSKSTKSDCFTLGALSLFRPITPDPTNNKLHQTAQGCFNSSNVAIAGVSMPSNQQKASEPAEDLPNLPFKPLHNDGLREPLMNQHAPAAYTNAETTDELIDLLPSDDGVLQEKGLFHPPNSLLANDHTDTNTVKQHALLETAADVEAMLNGLKSSQLGSLSLSGKEDSPVKFGVNTERAISPHQQADFDSSQALDLTADEAMLLEADATGLCSKSVGQSANGCGSGAQTANDPYDWCAFELSTQDLDDLGF